MVVLIGMVAAIIILIVVMRRFQRQPRDDAWQAFRKRQRERRKHAGPEEPIDPNFVFDDPPPDRDPR